mmetsp:Transcript_1295/g.2885  ORF Transcript_1295/g.2885 Transcript_1295/m.2885 type:complete len:219 (-) Transcript_1295:73-729(-)
MARTHTGICTQITLMLLGVVLLYSTPSADAFLQMPARLRAPTLPTAQPTPTTLFGSRRRSQRTKKGEVVEADASPDYGGVLPSSANGGRGLEVTGGVTLPSAEKPIVGWVVGGQDGIPEVKMCVAKVAQSYYALDAFCPRCGFDLWKGKLDTNGPTPRICCPICKTPFNGADGRPEGEAEELDLTARMARMATAQGADKRAKPYAVTVKESRVFVRER